MRVTVLDRARRLPDRRGWAVAVVVTAAVAPAAAGLGAWGSATPWPRGAAAIAAFVSHDRDLAFTRPVPVHFEAPGTFDRQVAAQDRAQSARTVASDRRYDAELRALGLIGAPASVGGSEQASDLAGAVVFLASDHARYITGATINVSGGWLMY